MPDEVAQSVATVSFVARSVQCMCVLSLRCEQSARVALNIHACVDHRDDLR